MHDVSVLAAELMVAPREGAAPGDVEQAKDLMTQAVENQRAFSNQTCFVCRIHIQLITIHSVKDLELK
jgi:hypothetical protein